MLNCLLGLLLDCGNVPYSNVHCAYPILQIRRDETIGFIYDNERQIEKGCITEKPNHFVSCEKKNIVRKHLINLTLVINQLVKRLVMKLLIVTTKRTQQCFLDSGPRFDQVRVRNQLIYTVLLIWKFITTCRVFMGTVRDRL